MKKTIGVLFAVFIFAGFVGAAFAKDSKVRKATKSEIKWYKTTKQGKLPKVKKGKAKGKILDVNGECGVNSQVGFAQPGVVVRCKGTACPPSKREICRVWVSTCRNKDGSTYQSSGSPKSCVEMVDTIPVTQSPDLD